MDASARHLQLLTETIAAVNSTLDLEMLGLVASKVAAALDADACFVYLYDERADELVLRATHGTRVEEMTRTPRMKPGREITGTAASDAPTTSAAQAHLDERLQGLFRTSPRTSTSRSWPSRSWPARSWRARSTSGPSPHASSRNARSTSYRQLPPRVAQTIEHAKLYADAQARVAELEALARISEAVSESLYLEAFEAIVKTTMEATSATGAALVLEDGGMAGPKAVRAHTPFDSRCAGSGGRSASSSATATRCSRTRSGRCSSRSPTTRRWRWSTGEP